VEKSGLDLLLVAWTCSPAWDTWHCDSSDVRGEHAFNILRALAHESMFLLWFVWICCAALRPSPGGLLQGADCPGLNGHALRAGGPVAGL